MAFLKGKKKYRGKRKVNLLFFAVDQFSLLDPPDCKQEVFAFFLSLIHVYFFLPQEIIIFVNLRGKKDSSLT